MDCIFLFTTGDLPEIRQLVAELRETVKRGPRKKAVKAAERFARGFHPHGWDPIEQGVNTSVVELDDPELSSLTLPPIMRDIGAEVLRAATYFWLVPSKATAKRLVESCDVFLGVAKRDGRKPDPEIAERNDRMRQAMAEGLDNDALAYRFGVSVATARKQRQLYEAAKR